jgi:glutamate/tyrosine decarboxylase-like PLP-dependent enzyme
MGEPTVKKVSDVRTPLTLEATSRITLWQNLLQKIEEYFTEVGSKPISPNLPIEKLKSLFDRLNLDSPADPRGAIQFVFDGFSQAHTNTRHPGYFGIFCPSAATMGIVADLITAAVNPQVGAWGHSPFAIQLERYLIQSLGVKYGYPSGSVDGTFANGGSEANHTAVLCALVNKFPSYGVKGTAALSEQPVFYISQEAHYSFLRIARCCGIGEQSVHEIPVDDNLQIQIEHLRRQIKHDRSQGLAPFMIIGTAGTTRSGTVDPLREMADVAEEEKLWFHVDAAWGGAAVLVPELRSLFDGIADSDSITVDAHKWFSVPMGAGIFLTRHKQILFNTFAVETDYLPCQNTQDEKLEPYSHSLQCSRRFTGLKLFLTLAVAGYEGYIDVIREMTRLGHVMCEKIKADGWDILNQAQLPVTCFTDLSVPHKMQGEFVDRIADFVISKGDIWISTTRVHGQTPVLRACISNYLTQEEDIDRLVKRLDEARRVIKDEL